MKSKLLVALLSVAATAIPSVVYAENSVATPLPQNLIFVSPHADDIALTFGGLINNEKGLSDKNNTTMLIFSQSQWTENDNAKDLSPQRISKVSQMRLNEDQAALDNLFNFNYRMETYGYPDAPIRHYEGPKTAGGGPGGNFSTFGTPEKQVYQDLVPMFENKLKTPNCAMFVLMANGYHVDHFIVREAVITAARNLGKKAQCQIYFGEDQPYTGAFPDKSKAQMGDFVKRLGLQKISYTINEKQKYEDFSEFYISQYSDDYITGLDSWAKVTGNKESLYLWPKENYSKAPIEENCKESFCR